MKKQKSHYDRYVKYEVEEVLSRFYKNQVGKEFVDLYREIDFETISIFEFEDFKIAKIDYDIIRKSSQYEIVEILKDFVDLLFSQMSEKINNSMNKNSLSIDEKIFRAKMIDE